MTNFERIKAMSADELAEILYDTADKVCFENCEKGTTDKFRCPMAENNIEPKHCIACMKKGLPLQPIPKRLNSHSILMDCVSLTKKYLNRLISYERPTPIWQISTLLL